MANQNVPENIEEKKARRKILKEFHTRLESEKERAEKKRLDNQALKLECEETFKKDAEARQRYDVEWLSRDLFRRGYQFTRYSSDTKTAVLSTANQVRIPINLLWAQERIIKNQVTSFRPKWEVMPRGKDESHLNNARYSGKLLDVLFDTLGLRKMIKETIIQGLNFSVGGPWEIGFDPMGDNGLGEVYIWLRDPYEFYIDGSASSPDLAERVHTAVRRPLDEVRTNPLYNTYDQELNSDSRLATSEYKQFLLQALRPSITGDDEQGGVIVKESWKKIRVSEKNKDELREELEANEQNADDLRQGEVLMKAVTHVDSLLDPLRVRLLRRSDYPFELYQADISPLEVYGESWAKHVIPANKLYNMVVCSEAEYLYKFAKGRVVIDKRSGVRMIDNRHASIIEKNRGAEVSFPPMPPLPSTYREVKETARRDIEDLGGAHDVCVSDKAEALTRNGWKKHNQIGIDDEIFTMNPETQKGEWNKVKKIHKFNKVSADLYEFENRTISALVTSNHKWLIRTDKGNGSRRNYRKEFEWRLTPQINCNAQIPLTAPCSPLPIQKTYNDNFVELVGWVITEGCYSQGPVNEKRGRRRIRISQSQHANSQQWENIDSLLKRMGIWTKPQLQKDGSTQFAFSGETAKKMRELLPDKQLTEEFVSRLTRKQLGILVETMIKADGSIERNCYYSTSKRNADLFQMAVTLFGINARIDKLTQSKNVSSIIRGKRKFKSLYRVNLRPALKYAGFTNLKRFNKAVRQVKYTGVVWCPEVDNGTWIMRYKGKVCVTGNSFGRIPAGIRSGVGIAELKSADASNQADLVDNLEDFLVRVGKKVLREISQHYTIPKLIKSLGKGGDPEHFMVIGEGAAKKRKNTKEVQIGADKFDLAVIGSDNEIRVNIGSWLAHTKSAQIDKLKEYYEAGLVDQKTFLEHAEFGDVANIVERTREEELLKKYRGTSAGGAEVSDEEVAEQENTQMVEEGKPAGPGGVWPMPEDNHQVHRIIHQEHAEHPEVAKHLTEHERMINLGITAPSTPEENVTPQGGLPLPAVQVPTPSFSPQVPTGGSPEEEALMQSLAELTGRGGR